MATKTEPIHLKIRVKPLTPALWPALQELFGPRGACNGCWCMYWRIGAAYRRRPDEKNRADFRQIVKTGPPPGLLAFDGEIPIGWCQLTPRADLPYLAEYRRLPRIDDQPVWALSCLYVRIGYRRRGVTARLIEAAVHYARKAGAPALEAYPLDAAHSPSATGTGYAGTFRRLGFKDVGGITPARPVLRHDLAS